MSVDWAVLRKDGRELGNLHNQRRHPVELDRDWPAIAREIAVSAAKGLRELLDKIPRKPSNHPQRKGRARRICQRLHPNLPLVI